MENERELNTELNPEDLEKASGGGIGVTDPAKRPAGFHCPQCGSIYIGDATYICSNCGYEDPNAPKSPFGNDNGWGEQLKNVLEDL